MPNPTRLSVRNKNEKHRGGGEGKPPVTTVCWSIICVVSEQCITRRPIPTASTARYQPHRIEDVLPAKKSCFVFLAPPFGSPQNLLAAARYAPPPSLSPSTHVDITVPSDVMIACHGPLCCFIVTHTCSTKHRPLGGTGGAWTEDGAVGQG